MTTFDQREKVFEDKYKHDQELQFKVEMRRNKLLGLWAAELLGLTGDEANAYAREVVASDMEEPGDADLVRKVMGDFAAKGIEMSEHRLRVKLEEILGVAKQQVMTE
ncbi:MULTISPECIES: DUF1476 domain-containing protein [Limibacillus]|jgi:hypothetical protein|uniref:DUF1476 domain-containing protein n=1 Tax=Limibacillus halophilus TaxID=1579333 RepID=A0A839SS75_9PROT|nr:DUF1476 domain-containing protein [Limibacillus halophilus]MBB3065168.1 hypothetical protein [Limibacillus halophilus]